MCWSSCEMFYTQSVNAEAIWSVGNVCREWLDASQCEPSSPNKYCDTNHLGKFAFMCLFGFVCGNWFICVVSWMERTAKQLWQLILKTSVQTYPHSLFLWNSSWFIPPCPMLGENQLLSLSRHWLSSELRFQFRLHWCTHSWAQLAGKCIQHQ